MYGAHVFVVMQVTLGMQLVRRCWYVCSFTDLAPAGVKPEHRFGLPKRNTTGQPMTVSSILNFQRFSGKLPWSVAFHLRCGENCFHANWSGNYGMEEEFILPPTAWQILLALLFVVIVRFSMISIGRLRLSYDFVSLHVLEFPKLNNRVDVRVLKPTLCSRMSSALSNNRTGGM